MQMDDLVAAPFRVRRISAMKAAASGTHRSF